MLVIGLTGGICAGKSTVARVLQDLGATVLDADKLGHKAYEPSTPCFKKLVAHFGSRIVNENGEVNRKVLGSIVFSEPKEMACLQSIVWPEIGEMLLAALQKFESEGITVVVLEAAVMIEAAWQNLVSCLWVVNVDKAVALQRLMVRNNLTEEEASKRVNSQLSNEERNIHADLVIDNSKDSIADLERVVRAAYGTLPLVA